MRIFKLAIISIVIFFVLFTLIALLIPSQVRISKAINVGAPRNNILSLVADTAAWRSWHPAFKAPPQRQQAAFSVQPLLKNDSLVTVNFTTPKGRQILNGWQLYRHPGTDSVTVQWYMDFQLPWYPWQKFGSLFYEATYGAMMQQGLQGLKTAAEAGKQDTLAPGVQE